MRDEEWFEREAKRLYELATLPLVGTSPAALARALLGSGVLRVAPKLALPGGGALVRHRGALRILIREGAPPEHARFTVVHELSHWALGPGASEDDCDALAARLLAPRESVEAAIRAGAKSFEGIAGWFRCTQTFAALRYGEVTGEPLVVVAPANVRIRGRAWTWPAEQELRALVRESPPRGLRKAELQDAPHRVVLRAG